MWGDFEISHAAGPLRASNTIRAQVLCAILPLRYSSFTTADLPCVFADVPLRRDTSRYVLGGHGPSIQPSRVYTGLSQRSPARVTRQPHSLTPGTFICVPSVARAQLRFTHAGALFWYSCIPQLPHCRSERLSPSRRKTAGILPMLCSLAATRLQPMPGTRTQNNFTDGSCWIWRRDIWTWEIPGIDWLRLKWFAVAGAFASEQGLGPPVVLPDRVDASPVRCMHRRSCDTVHVCLSHAFQSSSPLVNQAYTAREILSAAGVTLGSSLLAATLQGVDQPELIVTHSLITLRSFHAHLVTDCVADHLSFYGTVVLRPLRLRFHNG
jgi:hypothetical protein